MAKRAIIMGGTGLVGSYLMQRLIEAEHITSVVSVTRRPVNYASSKVENCVIDFNDLHAQADLFQGDVLYSCLGTTLKQAGSIEAQRVVDVDYQYHAAQCAVNHGVSHYLLVSSSGANAVSKSAYLKMKGELEEAVIGLKFPHTSILQPSLLLGDRTSKRFAEGMATVLMPALCKLPWLTRYRPIHASDVAEKLMELSVQPDATLETFNLDQVFPSQL